MQRRLALLSLLIAFTPILSYASPCTNPVAALSPGSSIPLGAWADPSQTKYGPFDENALKTLERDGVILLTAGGSSVSFLAPDRHSSVKAYYRKSPETIEQLISLLADAAEPALKSLIARGRFRDRSAPIVLLSSPGLAVDNRAIVLPGNFGKLGKQKFPIADLLRAELGRRAPQLGLSAAQVDKTRIYVENDSLPVVANAAYHLLGPRDAATVIFAGTGTGSAKVTMTGPSAFTMRSSEESHTSLGQYPELIPHLPAHLLIGAQVASGTDKALPPEALTLENISAGGRLTNEGNRTHLGGANSVALSFLLEPSEVPAWIRAREAGLPADRADRVRRSLGFASREDLAAFLASHPADRSLLDSFRREGSLSGKDLSDAAKSGSVLAARLMGDDTYAQGLVAGTISLNIGPTPVGTVLPADLVYGPASSPRRELKILVRASDAMAGWAGPLFARARQGVEDAKHALFSDPGYRARLAAAGYALDPETIHLTVEQVLPDPKLHPDFGGLDTFAHQLRSPR